VLGNAIADRLPATQARSWKKSLAACNMYGEMLPYKQKKWKEIPETPWPIDAVLLWYPVKRTYGEGEQILWELKLIGRDADHGLFLEVILPAIEQIGSKTDSWGQQLNSLWGHFDIQSVYTAKGHQWKPLVKNGKLDLRYKVNPSQWSLGIKFSNITSRALDRLTWLTPFALSAYEKTAPKTEKNKHPRQAPSLYGILEATSQRTAWIMLGNYATSDDFLKMIDPNARTAWQSAIKQASRIPLLRHDMTKVPSDLPGQWLGFQVFATSIPDAIIPYLELASIIHIGKYTHYGCGTFVLV